VTARGGQASRLRAAWRAIVVWLPAGAALLLLRSAPKIQNMTIAAATLTTLPLLLLAAGAIWAIARPSRALQDRLAGTWVVPR
jgi:hypothetical protein